MPTCPTCLGTGHFEPATTKEGRIKQIQELLWAGKTYREIGEVLHIHSSTVGHYVKSRHLTRVRTDFINNPESREMLMEEGLL
jgi:hypothetical protein